MTIVNLNVTHDHVWLVSDTLYYHSGKPYSLGNKFSVYPHLYGVVGFRGQAGLHHQVSLALNGAGLWVDLDAAVAGLPARLRRWQHELSTARPHLKVHGQLWLAGWSPQRESFAGWLFESTTGFERLELPVPGTWLNPGCEDAGFVPPAEIADPDQLVQCCDVQRQMSNANVAAGGADCGIGGEVILVQLTRNGFRISKRHRFEDYAETKEAIRAAA